MTDLIDDLFNCIPASIEIRNYKGYQQHREVLFTVHLFNKISLHLRTPWLFLVTDLHDEVDCANAICLVAKSDGTFELVSIDSKNRITIDGKKYFNWISYY